MDNRPIGVFDSGLGGLTAVSVLAERLPNENIIYFGDTGRMPYGGRPVSQLMKIAGQDMDFLMSFGVKVILAACGTVSTVALPTLAARYPVPVFGVVEPAARQAAALTKKACVGLIATQATVMGGAFARTLAAELPGVETVSVACPRLVPLIESGHTSPEDPEVMDALQEYLTPIRAAGADTLILGCTHYPLLTEAIRRFMGPEVELVSASRAAALELEKYLTGQSLCAGGGVGGRRLYTSGSGETFRTMAEALLKEKEVSVRAITPFAF